MYVLYSYIIKYIEIFDLLKILKNLVINLMHETMLHKTHEHTKI